MATKKKAKPTALVVRLEEYAEYIWPLITGNPFICRPFHRKIFRALEDVITGKTKKLIINLPPRHGKTLSIQIFIQYCYALISSDCEFIVTSYSDTLAKEITSSVKDAFNSATFNELYPHVQLKRDTTAKDYFKTTSGGCVYGAAAGGQLVGFGAGKIRKGFAGALIIDDPLKPEDYRKAARGQVNDWFFRTVLSRRNSDDTPIILIMQRLGPDDLTKHVQEQEPGEWKVLELEALTEHEDGRLTALWPDRKSVASLLMLKEADEFTFETQYQQHEAQPGGNMIKDHWFGEYEPATLMTSDDIPRIRFFTADTAFKATEKSDYSVICEWAASAGSLYLLNVWRGKWIWPDLEASALAVWMVRARNLSEEQIEIDPHVNDALRAKCIKYIFEGLPTDHIRPPPGTFFIEDRASGTSLVQRLEELHIPVDPWKTEKDKVLRVRASSLYLSQGCVKLPTEAPWLAAFVSECSGFREDMGHKHDDQVDNLTMAIDIWRESGGGNALRDAA